MNYKAHTRYELKDGTYVPGTTTITGTLNKPFLIGWANKLGLEGIDSTKYVDYLADIGTLTHYRVECYLKGVGAVYDDYTQKQIKASDIPFEKFLLWEKENEFEIIDSELALVSEKHRYGGTCDIYCMLNGKKTLMDIKTSKRCYPEHYMQVSAYTKLLIENGKDVESVKILRIGRNKNEGFGVIDPPKLNLYWKVFLHLLEIYKLQKEIG